MDCHVQEIELMGESLFRWGCDTDFVITGWGFLAILVAVSLLGTLLHGD